MARTKPKPKRRRRSPKKNILPKRPAVKTLAQKARDLGFKFFCVDLPQFPGERVDLIIGPPVKTSEFVSFAHDLPPDAYDAPKPHERGITYACNDIPKPPIIWMPEYPRTPSGLGILVHECIHVTFTLAHYLNLPRDNGTEEFFTYTTQYMYQELLREIDDYYRPRKKN